jgi:hypothetical protein
LCVVIHGRCRQDCRHTVPIAIRTLERSGLSIAKTQSAVFVTIQQVSEHVVGVIRPVPLCPSSMVTCHGMSSILGAELEASPGQEPHAEIGHHFGVQVNRRQGAHVQHLDGMRPPLRARCPSQECT